MTRAELWDLTDERGNRTGEVVRRGAPDWPAGRFHLVVATVVVRSDGLLLATRRSATKDFPLAWEFPGGSALVGESSRRAAARELREETGIAVAEADLVLVGRFGESRAHLDLYLVVVGVEPAIALDPVEVSEAEWITPAMVEARLAEGRFAEPWVARLEPLWPAILRHRHERVGRGGASGALDTVSDVGGSASPG